MKIHFMSHADDSMPSTRYRQKIPAKALTELGHEVTVGTYVPDGVEVLIFSKHFEKAYDRHMISEWKGRARTVFDVCDDHFDGTLADHYRFMCEHADLLTCSTPMMAAAIQHHVGRKASLVTDPYELPEAPPKFQPANRKLLKLAWYGHGVNLPTVEPLLPQLCELGEVVLVTNVAQFQQINERLAAVPWSPENQLQAMDLCDVVVIPTRADPKFRCKSPNRFVEAIRRGRAVAAGGLPAYEEFDEFFEVGDVIGGVKALAEQPVAVVEGQLAAAQAYVRERFAPRRVAEQWLAAISAS